MLILSVFAVSISTLSGQFVLAGKGEKSAVLVVPHNKSKAFTPAVRWFQKYCKKITGIDLKTAASFAGKRVEFKIDPKVDEDSFSIIFPGKDFMLITAGSSKALEFAVLELFERYAGCRWLYIGEDGDEIPAAEKIVFPAKTIKESPAFLSRTLSVTWTPTIKRYGIDWIVKLRRSVGQRRIRFAENLHKVIDPKIFGKSNPEFYQVYQGERLNILKSKNFYRWHPCFTAPGLADAVAELIDKDFRKTGRRDFSLGANDIDTYCECDICEKTDGNFRNAHGYRNRIASYISFCNKVAADVTAKYPDAKLGFLAYANLLEPPETPVHKALVPHITFDRMQWLIPEKRKMDQRITSGWKSKGVAELGWYDYVYGRSYLLPRMYLRLMQKYLKWAYENGVRHYYAEFKPSDDFHEGPKGYVLMKLLWDPYLDLEKLLDDWYVSAVGPKAAPYLKEYFDRIEDYLTKRSWKNNKFYQINDTFLNFGSNAYLDNYTTAELDYSAKLLDKVVELSTNKSRAERFRNAFRDREDKIRTYLRNLAFIRKASAYNFDTLVVKESFDRRMPGTWQTKKGKFIHAKKGGFNDSPCVILDLKGSLRRAMAFLYYRDPKDYEFFKVTIRYKVTGIDSQEGLHPDHWLATKVNLVIKWQSTPVADPYSKKVIWLHRTFESSVRGDSTADGKWRTMTVYCRRPSVPVKKMVVLFSSTGSFNGKIYFDDLEIRAAKTEKSLNK